MKKYLSILILASFLALPIVVHAIAGDLPGMATALQGVLTTVATTIVVICWIVTGILFLTATGSPEKLSRAKLALIWSVVGTVIIIVAPTAKDLIEATFT